MTTTTTTKPRIYVACLASYNEGTLHGAWIDCAGRDAEDLSEEIQSRVIATSKAYHPEEYAIHDHEGFGGLLGEYSSLDEVIELADAIDEHGEGPVKAYVGYAGEWDADDFTERYRGEWDSMKDYAESYLEDTGALSEVPEHLRYYIDIEAYARDMQDHYHTDGYVFYTG